MKTSFATLALVAALCATGAAQAASLVSPTASFAPTTSLFTFDGYDGLAVGAGKRVWLDADSYVVTDASAVIGANEQDLGGNGLWGARFDATPTGSGNFLSATGATLFSFFFAGPQAQVGAFFNLSQPLEGAKTGLLTLTAYSAANQVLESFSYRVDTAVDSYNEGMFLGFSRASADIHSFAVTVSAGQSLVMDDVHLSASPVPEPGSLALLAAGLAVVGGVARRRR